VILQVRAHTRQLVVHLDAGLLQHLTVADTGELQDVRRADGAGGQDHLAVGLHIRHLPATLVAHAHGLLAVEQYPVNQRASHHRQVRAIHDRAQVGVGGGGAHAVLHGHVHGAEAFLLVAVVVLRHRVARLFAGIDEGLVQGFFMLLPLFVPSGPESPR